MRPYEVNWKRGGVGNRGRNFVVCAGEFPPFAPPAEMLKFR